MPGDPTLPPPLLTYGLEVDPATIHVSTDPATPTLASLTFAVNAPPRQVIQVGKIAIHVPVDSSKPEAWNLSASPLTRDCATLTSTGTDTWTPALTNGWFVFTPDGGPVEISDQSLRITIAKIPVNVVVGTAKIVLKEWAAAGRGSEVPEQPTGGRSWDAVKFPSQFFFSNLAADRVKVRVGEGVTLTWAGSADALYSVATDNGSPVRVEAGPWTSPPLMGNTTFTVYATYTDPTTQASATRTLQIPIQVTLPEMLEFTCDPVELDYATPTTVTWRTRDADGIYIEVNGVRTRHEPGNGSASLVLSHGGTHLVAYAFANANAATHELHSSVHELDSAIPGFIPLNIIDFSASPASVDVHHPTTFLNVDVAHVQSVSVQGAGVDFSLAGPTVKARLPITPGARDLPDTGIPGIDLPPPATLASPYVLKATWVDGTVTQKTFDVTVQLVQFGDVTATIAPASNGQDIVVTVSVVATYVARVWVEFQALFCNGPVFNQSSAKVGTRSASMFCTNVPGTTTWQASETFSSADITPLSAYPAAAWLTAASNSGVSVQHRAEGENTATRVTVCAIKGPFQMWP
ncbi:hypothetical protein [Corallococcus exiguus]|uniref:Uncharacterized protein n=1 Tax=Corallococcus exiguus TaxID=83462 RepID=A0A7X5BT62_9BACT|nr:hypothetical protein [Corallococcus exiguus]NBC39857.1 hypothetical protein [Corallococcus exiguus]TNV63340.1 hypothetical protein FH620_15515 [Corallococcus exiguus]